MRLHKRELRLGRGTPRKALHGWLTELRRTDALIGRSAVWTLAGLSAAEVFALFSYAVQGLAALFTRHFWPLLGVRGERNHWHGELMASRIRMVLRCEMLGLMFCAIAMAMRVCCL